MEKVEQQTDTSFPSELLDEALFFVFDLMDDAQLEFFCMGKTAEQMFNNQWLTGKKLEFGVKKQSLTQDVIDTLKMVNPSIDIQDRKIIMEYKGVPIEVRIIRKHYRVLDNLDAVDYANESFLIPNPFDAFLRMGNFMH
jgi:hypothetical protein